MRMHVLHHAAEGPVTGAWMAAELRRHGYRISPGTLYPAMHALEAEGLLASHEAVDQGRAVRRYAATPAGRRALVSARTALAELSEELLGRPPSGATSRPGIANPAVHQLGLAAHALRQGARGCADQRDAGALTAAAVVVDSLGRMVAELMSTGTAPPR